ncbi:MAG: hypothetical protein LBH03_03250 [Holophagales bacterium]|jgi:hypothetical protein|nr:hypothetical protein [Holophagales bacterium]
MKLHRLFGGILAVLIFLAAWPLFSQHGGKGDVYVVTRHYTDGGLEYRYWKNGQSVQRFSTDGYSLGERCDVGGDVYQAWTDNDNGRHFVEKNNKMHHSITHNSNVAEVNSLCVSGGDIYAGGYESNPKDKWVAIVWKNDKVHWRLTNGSYNASVHSLCVSDGDIYAGGGENNQESTNMATVWKNGKLHQRLTNGGYNANVFSLCVSGGDVYAGGVEDSPDGNMVATMWKNGKLYQRLTNDRYNANVESLCVSGGDVYAGGYEDDSDGNQRLTVWKNGNLLYRLCNDGHVALVFVKAGGEADESNHLPLANRPDYKYGYVSLAIKGTNVNLRHQSQAKGDVIRQTNTGDVFIAEKWPVTNVENGMEWFKIVLSPDPKSGVFIPFNAYVAAPYAVDNPLTSSDVKRVIETPVGEGFAALSLSAENQRRMALDNGSIFHISGLSVGEEYAIYKEPSLKSVKKRFPITEEASDIWNILVVDKSRPGWFQIIGDAALISSGWVEAKLETLEIDDFSLGQFMSLCLGANVPEIMEKWGPGKVVTRDNSALIYESDWHTVDNTTKMQFDGLEVSFTDHRNFSFKLTRRGAGMGGIFIGEDWCNKDYLKSVFSPSSEETEGQQWYLNRGRDGWLYSYSIVFGTNGLVSELNFNCEDADLSH